MCAVEAKSPSQARSFVTLFFFAALNIVAGVGVELANLRYFGASPQKDAYDISYFIPHMLIYLFGLDIWKGLSTALFSRLSVNETEERWRVFSSILTVLLALGSALCVGCLFAAPWIVSVVASGFDPGRATLCTFLLRLNVPVILLLSVTGFFDSVLVAHHVYGWSSLSQVMLKASQVIAVVGWAPHYGIAVLPIGTLTGLSLALVFQAILLYRRGLSYHFLYLDWKSPKLREACRQVGPLFLSVAVAQAAAVCLQNVASHGDTGTVACLNYAVRFVAIVTQLVVSPLCTSYAPRIARYVELRDQVGARALTLRSATWMTYATWTIALVIVLACEPLLTMLASFSRLTAADVSLIAFFMRILALVGWCKGIGLLGVYLGLAKAAAWRVFLVNFADAVTLATTVLVLAATVGPKLALPTASLAAAAAGGVAGLVWIQTGQGGFIRIFARRVLGWALLMGAIGLPAGLFDYWLTLTDRAGLPVLRLVISIGWVLVLVPLSGLLLRMPELPLAFRSIWTWLTRRNARPEPLG